MEEGQGPGFKTNTSARPRHLILLVEPGSEVDLPNSGWSNWGTQQEVITKGIFALLTLLTVLSIPPAAFAKSATGKITIKGADWTTPIEISDPRILINFNVWTGPGTSSNEPQGLIVDWSQGMIAEPPKGVQLYEVSFYTKLPHGQLIYVVSYGYDPSSEKGYVYLPGKGEKWYQRNVRSIYRSVEGKWFHAWSVWDKVVRPLIAKAKTVNTNRSNIGSVKHPANLNTQARAF